MTDYFDNIDSTKATLEINARGYRYDPTLDPVADLIEQGPAACAGVHPKLLDLASIHLDFRNQYRAAVAAGAIANTQEK
jgi:hypothetical protein